jgi:hypothetical protein
MSLLDMMLTDEMNSNQLQNQSPSYKPIPKPRKSLMTNTVPTSNGMTTMHALSATPAAKAPPLIPPDSKERFPFYKQPPPLPPRATFSPSQVRPLPSLPERIDFAAASTLVSSTISTIENNPNCANGINKIYPVLENYSSQSPLTMQKSHYIPMDAASNSSDFSSADEYHSVFDFPASTMKFSAPYNSFYEPFGDVKSDGESVCFSGWIQLTPQGIIKQKKRGWAMIRRGLFFISADEEVPNY